MLERNPVLFGALVLGMIVAGCSESSSDPNSSDGGSGAGATTGNGASDASGGSGGSTSGGTGATGTGGSSNGGTSSGGNSNGGASGGTEPSACTEVGGAEIELLTTTNIAEMGTPFDADVEDLVDPFDWNTNYGKAPELVALADGENIDVLWQDAEQKKAFVVRAEKGETGYAVTRAYALPIVDKIMGFSRDEAGNYYYATGIDEDGEIDETTPAAGLHRSGIVRLIKFGPEGGCALLNVDVDLAREEKASDSEPIVNPMVAASSRLAYADGALALVHGINTKPDMQGTRHQKALTTHLDATTGAVTRTDSMWVSHSFDQRLFHDGTGFVELHLGDAYPRSIALGRFQAEAGTSTYQLFLPKGPTGENSTFTRLGGVVPIASGDFGYLVVFTTDRTLEMPTGDWQTLVGTRDLAFLRVTRDFAEIEPDDRSFIDGSEIMTVTRTERIDDMDVEVEYDNHFDWLTDYTGDSAQADRPRVAAIGGDQFVVLWERWNGADGDSSEFAGTQGLVIGADGVVTAAAKAVSERHLSRGDDVITVGNRALFVTGDAASKKLVLNFVSGDLSVEAVELP
jgi:hypothetical protein